MLPSFPHFASLSVAFRPILTMSNPPCCPPGSWPQALLQSRDELNQESRAVSPKGSVESLGKIQAYCVGTASKGSLLVFQDIYSSRVLHPKSRSGDRLDAICDVLADNGYAVCMPSLFGDKPYDLAVTGPADGAFETFDCFAQDGGVAWFQAQTYEAIKPIIQASYDALKVKAPDAPVMVLGFCFGTWLLSKASADFDFVAAVGCHPATALEAAVHQRDEVAMLKALRQPTLFLWAGNDSEIYVKGGDGVKALEATGGGVEEYPDMLHGWVCRGDVGDTVVKRDFEKAMGQISAFMAKHSP